MTKQEKGEARWLAVKSKGLLEELEKTYLDRKRVTRAHLAQAEVLAQDAESFAKTGKRH